MKPKERMIAALNKEIPDRLPITIHQWQSYHLKYHMNNMTALEAFKATGLDAAISYFPTNDQSADNPEWKVESEVLDDTPREQIIKYTVTTPKGNLTYQTGTNEQTTWTTDYMIKKKKDIEKLKYLPVPKLDKKNIVRVYDEVGNAGILRGFVMGNQVGCWQDACCLYDINDLILQTYDDPDWLHQFLGILLEKKLRYIEESLSGAKFDLIETGGGASSSTVISPKVFEEFCLPYDRKIHDALHRVGLKAVYHTCGGMIGILDQIIETHTDASETLSPVGMGGNIDENNAKEVYEKMHGKVALIGGMDQFNVLTTGTLQTIRTEVKRLFEVFGKDGGYICSACDHFFDTDPENLKAFAEAAKECVY